MEVEKIDTFGIHEFFGLARLTNWEVPLNKNQDDINFPLAQLENGENIPPKNGKNITKKIWTHYRAPICFVEDFRHFSCLGSQDGLGGQFFLWGEPLGSQRFQGDDLWGGIIKWEPVFFGGNFNRKQH